MTPLRPPPIHYEFYYLLLKASQESVILLVLAQYISDKEVDVLFGSLIITLYIFFLSFTLAILFHSAFGSSDLAVSPVPSYTTFYFEMQSNRSEF